MSRSYSLGFGCLKIKPFLAHSVSLLLNPRVAKTYNLMKYKTLEIMYLGYVLWASDQQRQQDPFHVVNADHYEVISRILFFLIWWVHSLAAADHTPTVHLAKWEVDFQDENHTFSHATPGLQKACIKAVFKCSWSWRVSTQKTVEGLRL